MSRAPISAEAKASMKANLEIEVAARKEKLLAMCEAQCASLRSRLERRVNRVPSNKRTIKLIDILEPPVAPKAAPARKMKEPVPAPALNGRRVRPAPPTAVSSQASTIKLAPKPAPRAASKATRALKRASDEISADDKENNTELAVPKKRVKAAAPAPRATRATRAASKKTDPSPHVLSPKTNNARPTTQTRTRRVR
ncbi:hypothetical protein M011DRAFT_483824 [Sporormia fimetaria CBS 119925]|uniref:Borealin N-terminal domain-containing protein n=1 Tax=Sporormia fimetaria CBS 119925 TaxID=1340428 RepID=A0A6A6VK09_9PLEO|nr:hypothetical protein M011DRAFT_483824 [Sporormia fimetaria CBS 119925]